jgi:hypothetical protein
MNGHAYSRLLAELCDGPNDGLSRLYPDGIHVERRERRKAYEIPKLLTIYWHSVHYINNVVMMKICCHLIAHANGWLNHRLYDTLIYLLIYTPQLG